MFPHPWNKFLPHGTAHLSKGEQYMTLYSIHLVKVWQLLCEPTVHVNSVVGILWSVGWEIGEDIGEYLVRKLED